MTRVRPPGAPPEILPLRLRDIGGAFVAGMRGLGHAPLASIACGAPFALGIALLPLAGSGLLVGLAFLMPPVFAVLQGESRFALLHERGGALLALACLAASGCLLWLFGTWGIAAAFPGALVNWRWLVQPERIMLAGAELSFLLVMAAALYAALVMAVAMVTTHGSDPVTAVLHSVSVLRENLPVMSLWAVICAVLALVAAAPHGAGLLIAVPLLAHANAELSRRALR